MVIKTFNILLLPLLSSLVIILTSILSGCSGYKSAFDCKPERGMGCMPTTEINNLVDRGQLPEPTSSSNNFNNNKNHKKTCQNNCKPKREIIRIKNKVPFPQVIPNDLHNSEVYRKPEGLLRIWIAPYVNQDGTYNEAQYIHEVIEPGKWLDLRKENA